MMLRRSHRSANSVRCQLVGPERHQSSVCVAEDLEAAFNLIEELPYAGETIWHPRIPNLRRILLGRVQHPLYYPISPEESAVEVLALWHTSRSSRPQL